MDKTYPQILLSVEWGLQCAKGYMRLQATLDTEELKLRKSLQNETDANEIEKIKTALDVFSKVREWGKPGEPYLD